MILGASRNRNQSAIIHYKDLNVVILAGGANGYIRQANLSNRLQSPQNMQQYLLAMADIAVLNGWIEE